MLGLFSHWCCLGALQLSGLSDTPSLSEDENYDLKIITLSALTNILETDSATKQSIGKQGIIRPNTPFLQQRWLRASVHAPPTPH